MMANYGRQPFWVLEIVFSAGTIPVRSNKIEIQRDLFIARKQNAHRYFLSSGRKDSHG